MSTYSVTERASFKRCRRQWFWGSFNGEAITPAFPAAALNVGTIWHKAGELWAESGLANRMDGLPTSRLVDCMYKAWEQVEKEITTQLNREFTVDEQYALVDQRRLLEAMAINYEGFWHTPLEPGFRMIQPEQTVVIDVPNSPHKLEATLDGLIKNENNGLTYVLERKTYSARPNEESLQFGDQYIAYLWVLQQLGFRTGGVAYDGAWKRESPPRGKIIDDLFLRFIITRNQAEIDEFASFLPAELQAMEDARLDPSLRFFNRRWEGCWDCGSFKRLCQATSRGEPLEPLLVDFVPRQVKDRAAVWNDAT